MRTMIKESPFVGCKFGLIAVLLSFEAFTGGTPDEFREMGKFPWPNFLCASGTRRWTAVMDLINIRLAPTTRSYPSPEAAEGTRGEG